MSATQITIRIDSATKTTIAGFADSLGLSTGAFLLAAAKDAIDRGSVTLRPIYSQKFLDEIAAARADYQRGNYQKTDTSEETLAYLDNLMKKQPS